MKKIAVILGTRPEAIKLAPVILALKQDRSINCQVCVTAQHRAMLDQVLATFGILPDTDMNLMRENQGLGNFTSRAVRKLDQYMAEQRPDLLLVQGDTTTVFCAVLAAFYHHVPIGHVEAGLRTWNLEAPWPEEANRVLTSRLATLHFAPTQWCKNNLLKEGVPAKRIFVTGNTVIDALFIALKKVHSNPPRIPGLPELLQPASIQRQPSKSPPRIVLITGHRRENFGKGFENICRAIARLARKFPDVHFVYPVHLNPNVREPVYRILGRAANSTFGPRRAIARNVHLIGPLSYLPFVALMNASYLILTDSGGIQEEAPSLGKPVLVMRGATERPEGVEAGGARLTGTALPRIFKGVCELLRDPAQYRRMAKARRPYGDGAAAPRVIQIIKKTLGSGFE